jgi:hypothetical protein
VGGKVGAAKRPVHAFDPDAGRVDDLSHRGRS